MKLFIKPQVCTTAYACCTLLTGLYILLTVPANTGLSQEELVATLRSRARKSSSQTSTFRGVSLLKQTGKWHAQINVGGKQVFRLAHLRCKPCITSPCLQ